MTITTFHTAGERKTYFFEVVPHARSCPHSLLSVHLRSFKQLIGGLGDANNKQCDSDEVKAK